MPPSVVLRRRATGSRSSSATRIASRTDFGSASMDRTRLVVPPRPREDVFERDERVPAAVRGPRLAGAAFGPAVDLVVGSVEVDRV